MGVSSYWKTKVTYTSLVFLIFSVERSKEKVTKELNLLCLHHSERTSERRKSDQGTEQINYKFSSGNLSHALSLTSAYTHLRYGQREATTFQEEWNTVDYIFYR